MQRLKIITVKNSDTIETIEEKIQESKADKIVLSFSSHHRLLQSIHDLTLFREKNKENIEIMTTEPLEKKLVQAAGFRLFSNDKQESDQEDFVTVTSIKKKKQKKIHAQKNNEEVKVLLIQKFKEQLSGIQLSFGRPSIRAIISIVFFSVLLFFFISWIALPSATITISPRSEVIQQVINVTLQDETIYTPPPFGKERRIILPSKWIETKLTKEMRFPTTNKLFEGTNATGTVKIINTRDEPMTLRNTTRIQTPDGMIFRLKKFIKIPGRSVQKNEEGKEELIPGEYRVAIEADPFDAYGKAMGSRGNIESAKVIFPGLPKNMQSMIWGEIDEPTQGGLTKWKFLVSQADIDIATKKLEQHMLEQAAIQVDQYLSDLNIQNNTSLIRLQDTELIQITNVDIPILSDLIGQTVSEYHLSGTMDIRVIAYDHAMMNTILEEKLLEKIHPQMILDFIDLNNAVFQVFEQTEEEVKMAVTLKGRQTFALNEEYMGGTLEKKIKTSIRDMPIREAKKRIENFREISEVTISVWPPFLRKTPKLPENILVKTSD